METNNQVQQFAPLQMSKPVIQALITKELSGARYNEILQAASDLSFSKDNLSTDYPALKELEKLIKLIDEKRKQIKEPYKTVVDDIDSSFKALSNPLDAILKTKKAELRVADEAAQAEKRQAAQEQQRKENILLSIANFINQTTREVSEATTDSEITRIQKMVGVEKSKKNFYAEYYDELVSKCDALEQPIKDRKNFIKEKAEIEKQMQTADATKLVELKEQQEELEAKTNESAIVLQEVAFDAASTIQKVVGEPIIETVKPRMTKWKWRVDDIALLQKKMPHLVKLVPNDEAIEVLFQSKKAEKAFVDGEELKIFGLTIYQEKFY